MKSILLRAALVAGAGLAIAGCTSYGRGYGYSGVSVGYASPYYGWYDNYYYPGVGYYVYERSGARHRWNGGQRHYWESRRGSGRHVENWSGYNHGARPGGHDNRGNQRGRH